MFGHEFFYSFFILFHQPIRLQRNSATSLIENSTNQIQVHQTPLPTPIQQPTQTPIVNHHPIILPNHHFPPVINPPFPNPFLPNPIRPNPAHVFPPRMNVAEISMGSLNPDVPIGQFEGAPQILPPIQNQPISIGHLNSKGH